ncbi:MAG: InlB B-repeat-containing protein, partial [Bacillota bacterium]
MYKNKYLIVLILTLMVISFAFLLSGCDSNQTSSVIEESYAASGTVKDNEGNGIEEVTVNFSNHGTAETNSEGAWQKVGLTGTVTVNLAKEGYSFIPNSMELSEPKTNIEVTAEKKDYTLNIDVNGNGSVKSNPTGTAFEAGKEVQLTAEADTGSKFDHWEGDLTGSNNPATVTIDDNKSITAVFVEKDYSLQTSVNGEGAINERKISTKEVEVTANPSTGWKFDHWEGDLSGSVNPETITVDSPKSVTAVFVKKEYSLSINTEGSGSVTKTPNSKVYEYGEKVQLDASAATNWYFNNWKGDLTGSNNPTNITIDGNKTITAVFSEQSSTENDFTLNVGEAGSVVVTEPNGTKVTVNENESYTYSTQQAATLSLSANPQDARYKFRDYSGDYSSTNSSVNVSVDSNMVVNANFKGNVFKMINSWGATWGPNNDGSLFITYDAAKQVNLKAWVIGKRNNYKAEALALFDVEGSNRGLWKFKIIIPSRSYNSEKSFYPAGQYLKGGSASFPANKMALDITELLPFEGEDIVLQVTNNSPYSGTLESFAVEANGTKFDSNTPKLTVSGNTTKTITIKNVSATNSAFAMQSSDYMLESASRAIKNSDIDDYLNTTKVSQTGNKVINGFGTGW